MALGNEPNLGLPKTKEIADLVLHTKKVISIIKILHFQVCIFQDSHEIRLISWMKSSGFHHDICRIS